MNRGPRRRIKPGSLLYEGDGYHDRQEVHEHWMSDDPDDNENEESLNGGGGWRERRFMVFLAFQ